MRLSLSIALRYLFAKKSQNIINVISMISVAGVFTGTLALLIVLSVFNGLHALIGTLYGSFDPDLKIEPVSGKIFHLDSIPYQNLIHDIGVSSVSQVLSDQVLLKYDRRQMPALLMGVDSNFAKVSGVDSIMVDGKFDLSNKNSRVGVLGYILAEQLSVGINFVTPMGIYAPRREGTFNMMNPESGFRSDYLMPSGIFAVKQVEYDSQYLLSDISRARSLFEQDSLAVSSLYVKVKSQVEISKTKERLTALLGKNYHVLNKEEQHASFYKMMKVEKLMAFLILTFIMIIATFNIIGTLSMLIYEKKDSIQTLKSMGADRKMTIRIFLFEGWLVSLTGILSGLIIGSGLILLQQQFGIIKFQGGDSFVVDAYPIILQLDDMLIVFATVSIIGMLASWYPVHAIVGKLYSGSDEK